jgi:hypothetical protein
MKKLPVTIFDSLPGRRKGASLLGRTARKYPTGPREKVHPTIKQQALAEEMITNHMRPPAERKNKKEMAAAVGLKHFPGPKLRRGLKAALENYGLTKQLVTEALVEDIKQKPQQRLGELRLAAEILDMTNHEGAQNKTLIVMVSGQSAERYGIQTVEHKEVPPKELL